MDSSNKEESLSNSSESYSSNDSSTESSNEPINDEHKQLHTEFLKIVDKMVEAKCPLPNFKLYYMVMYHSDRAGKVVKVKPFLTHKEAEDACSDDEEWEDKYGSNVEYYVIDSTNRVQTENFYSSKNVGTEIDIKIPNYY